MCDLSPWHLAALSKSSFPPARVAPSVSSIPGSAAGRHLRTLPLVSGMLGPHELVIKNPICAIVTAKRSAAESHGAHASRLQLAIPAYPAGLPRAFPADSSRACKSSWSPPTRAPAAPALRPRDHFFGSTSLHRLGHKNENPTKNAPKNAPKIKEGTLFFQATLLDAHAKKPPLELLHGESTTTRQDAK